MTRPLTTLVVFALVTGLFRAALVLGDVDCSSGCNDQILAYEWTTPDCFCTSKKTCLVTQEGNLFVKNSTSANIEGGDCILKDPKESYFVLDCNTLCSKLCKIEITGPDEKQPPESLPDMSAAVKNAHICTGEDNGGDGGDDGGS